MQHWGVIYWETYDPVVDWIIVRLILAISIICEVPIRSIEFVLAFPQADLDVDVFMEIPLVMLVNGNKGELVIKLNK